MSGVVAVENAAAAAGCTVALVLAEAVALAVVKKVVAPWRASTPAAPQQMTAP